jgi:hypothetical protein
MRRRSAGGSVPPERLLRLRVEDWPEPGPEPVWWASDDPEPWALHEARLRWHRARAEWVCQTGRTAAVVDSLFGPGYDAQTDDPRAASRERRRIERIYLPRAEWTHHAA